jgi:type VII secretion effector (TIGR04197 family)
MLSEIKLNMQLFELKTNEIRNANASLADFDVSNVQLNKTTIAPFTEYMRLVQELNNRVVQYKAFLDADTTKIDNTARSIKEMDEHLSKVLQHHPID